MRIKNMEQNGLQMPNPTFLESAMFLRCYGKNFNASIVVRKIGMWFCKKAAGKSAITV